MYTLNSFQLAAAKFATHPAAQSLIYPALGLAGEAGEVADKVKKLLRDHHGTLTDSYRHDIALELGDVLWSVALCARDIGYSLEEVGQLNIDKLQSRLNRGCIHGNGDNR